MSNSRVLNFERKKHLKFDQGLDVLIFYHGNRGKTYEQPMETTRRHKNIWKMREIQGRIRIQNLINPMNE